MMGLLKGRVWEIVLQNNVQELDNTMWPIAPIWTEQMTGLLEGWVGEGEI